MLLIPRRCAALLTTCFLTVTSAPLARAEVDAQFAASADLARTASLEIVHARRHVDVVLPDLDDVVVVGALTAAAQHGVAVRVLTSARAVAGNRRLCRACAQLAAAGATLRRVDARLLERFVVIDGPRSRAATGILGRALALSGDLGAAPDDASLVRFVREGDTLRGFQAEFDRLWRALPRRDALAVDDGKTDAVRAPAVSSVLFSAADLEPATHGEAGASRLEVVTASLVTAINQAYDDVSMSAPRLRSPALFGALAAAAARGVRVRLVVPAAEYEGPQAARAACDVLGRTAAARRRFDECLAHRGADVRYLTDAEGLASQYVIIDGRTLLTGDFALALSPAAGRHAFGMLLSLRGAALETFQNRFETVFARALQPRHPLASRASYALAANERAQAARRRACGGRGGRGDTILISK